MSVPVEVSHPLIKHHLSRLRDKHTPPAEFRQLVHRLAVLLAYEATSDLTLRSLEIETPLTRLAGHALSQRIGLVPILRAGLGMVDPILNLIPTAEVWHLGLYRDEQTLKPVQYYNKLPVTPRVGAVLLLDAGHPWATVSAVLFCSASTISRWKRRFGKDGVDAVLGRPRGRKRSGIHIWATLVVRWVLTLSPAQFRFARSRWSCEAAAVVLREDYRVAVGRETVRRWLREADLVWRRPRPTIRPKDPDREKKLRALRALLKALPAGETAVFMDEVDVNLNPKVGCMVCAR